MLQFSDIPDFAGLKEEDYNVEQICVFWDQALNDGYGNWSSEGCRMASADSNICECTHLTSFALLMVSAYSAIWPPQIFEISAIWTDIHFS